MTGVQTCALPIYNYYPFIWLIHSIFEQFIHTRVPIFQIVEIYEGVSYSLSSSSYCQIQVNQKIMNLQSSTEQSWPGVKSIYGFRTSMLLVRDRENPFSIVVIVIAVIVGLLIIVLSLLWEINCCNSEPVFTLGVQVYFNIRSTLHMTDTDLITSLHEYSLCNCSRWICFHSSMFWYFR